MNLAELRALAISTGFPDPDLAAAVAMAESSGNPSAVGDQGTSFGLWQIHQPAHPEYNSNSLLDPNYNASAAFAISSQGTNWTPWSTYNSGAFAKFYFPSSTSKKAWIVVGVLAALSAVYVWTTIEGTPQWVKRLARG